MGLQLSIRRAEFRLQTFLFPTNKKANGRNHERSANVQASEMVIQMNERYLLNSSRAAGDAGTEFSGQAMKWN